MNLLQEQNEIKRGLLFFWNCKVCKKLGWDKYHGCPDNNKDCGIYLYNRLKTHFEAVYKSKWQVEGSQKK